MSRFCSLPECLTMAVIMHIGVLLWPSKATLNRDTEVEDVQFVPHVNARQNASPNFGTLHVDRHNMDSWMSFWQDSIQRRDQP